MVGQAESDSEEDEGVGEQGGGPFPPAFCLPEKRLARPNSMEGTPPASIDAAIQSCLPARMIIQAGTPARQMIHPAALSLFSFRPRRL